MTKSTNMSSQKSKEKEKEANVCKVFLLLQLKDLRVNQ